MDDDDISISPYEEGTWEWSEESNSLEFKSSIILPSVPSDRIQASNIMKTIEFSDCPDLFDLLRFQKHYQRPIDESVNDVVRLQDIKDVVLFSAPSTLLSIPIINILHLPATERLLRALIFYCQYFLQVQGILTSRSLQNKFSSRYSVAYEAELSTDLQDLRFLVAKEYSTMIIGGDGFGKYHHMGRSKHLSANTRDAVFYETFFRMVIQIVWIALGRRSGKDIEIEVSRLFKSDRFNFAEHKYKLRETKRTEESLLMSGNCVPKDRLLKTESPLIHEIFCQRPIAYRMSGVGVVKYPNLSPRLRYFKNVLTLPVEEFRSLGITIGILGLSRKMFDPMLKEVKQRKPTLSRLSLCRKMSKASISASSFAPTALFPDIELPKRPLAVEFGDEFPGPTTTYSSKSINIAQRTKWIEKVQRRLRRKRETASLREITTMLR